MYCKYILQILEWLVLSKLHLGEVTNKISVGVQSQQMMNTTWWCWNKCSHILIRLSCLYCRLHNKLKCLHFKSLKPHIFWKARFWIDSIRSNCSLVRLVCIGQYCNISSLKENSNITIFIKYNQEVALEYLKLLWLLHFILFSTFTPVASQLPYLLAEAFMLIIIMYVQYSGEEKSCIVQIIKDIQSFFALCRFFSFVLLSISWDMPFYYLLLLILSSVKFIFDVSFAFVNLCLSWLFLSIPYNTSVLHQQWACACSCRDFTAWMIRCDVRRPRKIRETAFVSSHLVAHSN